MIIKKQITVVTQNCAGWNWKTNKKDFKTRLKAMLEKIWNEDPDIVGLQESYFSSAYRNVIEEFFPEDKYIIIAPKNYNAEANKKSVISIMILKKQDLQLCEQLDLPGLEASLRHTYVEAHYDYGKIRPLNLWIPQTSLNDKKSETYRKERLEFKEKYIKAVLKETNLWSDSDQLFIPLGDYNLTTENLEDLEAGEASEKLVEPLKPEDKGAYTWHDSTLGPGSDIDHIRFGAKYNLPIAFKHTRIDYSPINEGLSDHAMLVGYACLVE